MHISSKSFTAPGLAVSFVLLSLSAAFAADLPEAEPIIPQASDPAKIDTSEWGGFYVGAYGGYTWLQAETNLPAEASDENGRFGGYTGYNWQFDNRIVTGVEAQAGFANTNTQAGNVAVEQNWDASLRARLGYAFENSLLYSFAGLSVSSVEARALTGSDENTLTGFDIGAGVEFEIFEDVTARIEYDYDQYSNETFALGAGGNRSVDLDAHNVNVGIGLKF